MPDTHLVGNAFVGSKSDVISVRSQNPPVRILQSHSFLFREDTIDSHQKNIINVVL